MPFDRDLNVVLIGFRGAGKTVVGERLARLLERHFLDLDRELEARAGASVAGLFAREGESGFRRRETALLVDLAAEEPRGLVIATGGGVVERTKNLRLLRRLGVVVWLQVAEAELRRRLARDSARPAVLGDSVTAEVGRLLRRRRPLYRSVSDFAVRAGRSPPERVAARIARRLGGVGRRRTLGRGRAAS